MKKGFYLQSLLVLCFVLFSAVANATLPTITKNPVNKTVCRPDTTYFTTAAIDTPGTLAITYSWQVSEDGGANWTTITKDTLEYMRVSSDSLVVMTDTSISGNLYRSIATNTDGADTSAGALLTVLYPTAGTISGSNVCKAGTTTLGSTVLGGVWISLNNSIATIGSSTGVVTGLAFGYDTIEYAVTNTCGPDTAMFVIHVDTTLIVAPILGPNVVCKGNFISLTNTNTMFGTGVWSESTGNTTVSSKGSVVGVAQGTDVINYTFTNACNSVSSNKTVSVDTVLDPGTISGTTSDVCYGSWIHLTASKVGGIWITGSSAVAVVDGSGNVTGVSQGTAVISYIYSNACGVSAATDTITVFANTAMIGGIDSVGIHLSRTLTDSTTGGKWYSSDTSIAIIDTFTGVVTGKDTGFVTITYTVTNLCGTSSSYLTLTVGPPPFPGKIYGSGTNFDSSVCKGATIALFDTAKNGTGTWSSTQDTLASIDMNTGVVTGLKPGLDTIIYTFTNALGTSKAILPFYVNIPPVVKLEGPTTVKVGADLIFRATPYQDWTHTPSSIDYPTSASDITIGEFTDSNKHMGDFIAVVDSSGLHRTNMASYIVFHGGTDNIIYTVKNSCGTTKSNFRIYINPVGVPQVSNTNTSLSVFPNPTDGAVTINLNSDFAEDADVVITNVLGAKVRAMKITTNKAYNIRLDEPAGVYFLSASNATGKYDATIVVSK